MIKYPWLSDMFDGKFNRKIRLIHFSLITYVQAEIATQPKNKLKWLKWVKDVSTVSTRAKPV